MSGMIEGRVVGAGGQPVAGSLSLTQSGDSAALTGALELGRLLDRRDGLAAYRETGRTLTLLAIRPGDAVVGPCRPGTCSCESGDRPPGRAT